MTTSAAWVPAPAAARRKGVRRLVLAAAVLASLTGGAMFTWTHYEPFHRARRDADRVFRALTGTNPSRHDSYGNYLGFDAPPTAVASGPLRTSTTVRDEMYRFVDALARAGYRADQRYAYDPRLWCHIQNDFWGPTEAPPAQVQVDCSAHGSNTQNTAHATLRLTFEVTPALLHPTRTVTGWFNVTAENAQSLLVTGGTIEVEASRQL